MLIIGHRGASSLEPENTIRSFKKAEELGVDMIEMDLRLSKDGEIVISHDPDLKRLFEISKNIANMNLDEIKEITRNAGREMPTLPEALSALKTPINFHVKVHGLEEKLIYKIKNFPQRVLISSTFPGVLEKVRALDGNIELGLVIGRGELHLLPIIKRLTANLDLYSIHPRAVMVSLISIPVLKRLQKKIFVWTVNDQITYKLMRTLRVDGIFTDCPQLFINR